MYSNETTHGIYESFQTIRSVGRTTNFNELFDLAKDIGTIEEIRYVINKLCFHGALHEDTPDNFTWL